MWQTGSGFLENLEKQARPGKPRKPGKTGSFEAKTWKNILTSPWKSPRASTEKSIWKISSSSKRSQIKVWKLEQCSSGWPAPVADHASGWPPSFGWESFPVEPTGTIFCFGNHEVITFPVQPHFGAPSIQKQKLEWSATGMVSHWSWSATGTLLYWFLLELQKYSSDMKNSFQGWVLRKKNLKYSNQNWSTGYLKQSLPKTSDNSIAISKIINL